MKVKQWGVWLNTFTKRWNKEQLWDSFCLVSDAWLDGYRNGRKGEEGDVEVEVPEPTQNWQLGMEDKYSKFTMQQRLERDFGKMYGCSYLKCQEDGEDILVFARFKNRYNRIGD